MRERGRVREKNNLINSFRPPTIPFPFFLSHHFLLQAGSALFSLLIIASSFNHFFLSISPVLSPLFVFSSSISICRFPFISFPVDLFLDPARLRIGGKD